MAQASPVLCAVCGHLGVLAPGPGGRRPYARCRRCGSLERHRALTGLLPGLRSYAAKGVLVDVAPSRQVTDRLRRLAADAGVAYVGIDFDPGADNRVVNVQASMTRLPLLDASVGLMVCFHVLEHIPDDAAAMSEMARVLAPGGVAVVQVPRRLGLPTDEDPEAPEAERLRRFGQRDHVRYYGDDFEDRLRAAGLKVSEVTMKDLYRPIESDLLGIEPNEPLWLCTTDSAMDVERLAECTAASARAAVGTALDRLVAERNATPTAAAATQRDQKVAKLSAQVERLRSRVRKAEKARDAAINRERHLRRRLDVRVTTALARRVKRLIRRPASRRTEPDRQPLDPGVMSPPQPAPPVASVADLELLLGSAAFDQAWYELESGRSFSSRDEAVTHYCTEGAAMQLSPHPLFDPTTVAKPPEGKTPLGAYLAEPSRWRRSPHPGWDVDAYLRREPDAAGHDHGALGHLGERLTDTTELDVCALAGPARVRWGDAQAWRDVALTWTAQQRLRLVRYFTELPHDPAPPVVDPVDHTPETLVSVVIPTWNRSAKLQRALSSLRAQRWQHWEALVVDDGSEDDTREVVTELARKDPRIRLIVREHEGVCAARNAGIAAARGGFLAFLDSDNEWTPAYLETMVSAMTTRRLDAAYATLMVRTKSGPRYRASQVTPAALRVANHVDMNVLVVRSTVLEEVGGFDVTLRRMVDYDLVLRIADHVGLVHVPVLGALYDSSGPDRISAREPWAWYDYIKLRRWVDWDRLEQRQRDEDLVSVVVPCGERPELVLDQLQAVADALRDRPWEAVVVDTMSGRRLASLLAGAVTTAPVHYERIPMRVSYAFATDVGFRRAQGATLLVLGHGEVPDVDALRQLVDYAEQRRTVPYLAQPITVDGSGTVVTAGAAIGAGQRLPGALLAGQHLDDLDSAPAGLSAPDGRTFVIRSDVFARLRGLDVFLDNELEVADLGLRLRALEPGASLDLLPAARVRRLVHAWNDRRSAASRRIFTERYASLPPTPTELWTRLGVAVPDVWQELDGQPYAVRALSRPTTPAAPEPARPEEEERKRTTSAPRAGSAVVARVLRGSTNETRLRVFDTMLGWFTPGRLLDLGAGHGAFSIRAADAGWDVTAVDARTTRFPDDARVTWVHSDVRETSLEGYDLIVNLGLFYHLTLDDQLDLLDRAAGTPMILDTHVATDEPSSFVLSEPVRQRGYDGRLYAEPRTVNSQQARRSAWGNSSSFWATPAALRQMLDERGWDVYTLTPYYLATRTFFLCYPRGGAGGSAGRSG
ncbi:MAG TPA: glycosyltransferase [Propionibacteriaceae bacterium]|nr:glycosyltransferase [Propionibacteriaceae bacterium]